MRKAQTPSRFIRGVITLIAAVQIILGVMFLLSPGSFPALVGLPAAPAWTDWIFGMFGARALGFAFGMLIALRDTKRHAAWLAAMVGVQALDWIATILAVAGGKATLAQVSTASFFPLLFIAALAFELYRGRKSRLGELTKSSQSLW